MLKYGKQYQEAGFPSITVKSESVIKIMTFIWTITTAISALLLPFFKITLSDISTYGIILASLWLIYQFLNVLLKKDKSFKPGKYFMKINYYVLVMIIILITDHLILKVI